MIQSFMSRSVGVCRSFLASACVLSGALVAPIGAATLCGSAHAEPDGATVGFFELEGSVREKPGALDWLLASDAAPTLRQLVDAIDRAGTSSQYAALVIRLKDIELKGTQVEEVGAAILRARAAGKKVHVYAEAFGGPEMRLASYADEIIVQRGGPIELPGVYMEEMFLADTLAWAGVKADMVQIGDYKGASEQMSRSAPSPQWDQNISQLLDSLYANSRASIKQGRKLSDQQLDAAMNTLWLADGEAAKAAGLVDAVIDLPEIDAHLAKAHSATITWSDNLAHTGGAAKLDLSNPFLLMQKIMTAKPPTEATRPTIAVLHIDGTIVDGDSSSGGLMGGEGSVGSRTIRNAIEDVIDQDNIKGVIVRIESPGGSATASEVIWQGLHRLAGKKPVWVSVGSMAASGGYYCAVGGNKIYVNPSSIVGSIGVVGGRLSMAGLYDKLKVHVVGRARGPRSGLFRSTEPWTPDELAFVRGKMQETYDLFTSRVTAGRKGIDLSKTAEGRLFTGEKAVALKMADKVGGLHDAIGDLAADLHLDSYAVMDFPGPKPLNEALADMFKGIAGAPRVPGTHAGSRAASAALLNGELADLGAMIFGDRAWSEVRESVQGLLQLRDHPVLLLSPKVLIFK